MLHLIVILIIINCNHFIDPWVKQTKHRIILLRKVQKMKITKSSRMKQMKAQFLIWRSLNSLTLLGPKTPFKTKTIRYKILKIRITLFRPLFFQKTMKSNKIMKKKRRPIEKDPSLWQPLTKPRFLTNFCLMDTLLKLKMTSQRMRNKNRNHCLRKLTSLWNQIDLTKKLIRLNQCKWKN